MRQEHALEILGKSPKCTKGNVQDGEHAYTRAVKGRDKDSGGIDGAGVDSYGARTEQNKSIC